MIKVKIIEAEYFPNYQIIKDRKYAFDYWAELDEETVSLIEQTNSNLEIIRKTMDKLSNIGEINDKLFFKNKKVKP